MKTLMKNSNEYSNNLVDFLRNSAGMVVKNGFVVYVPNIDEVAASRVLDKKDLEKFRGIIRDFEIDNMTSLIIEE